MRNAKLKRIGWLISIILGLEVLAVFYIVFGINPRFIPVLIIVAQWFVHSVLIACIIDELFKRKFRVRLI